MGAERPILKKKHSNKVVVGMVVGCDRKTRLSLATSNKRMLSHSSQQTLLGLKVNGMKCYIIVCVDKHYPQGTFAPD